MKSSGRYLFLAAFTAASTAAFTAALTTFVVPVRAEIEKQQLAQGLDHITILRSTVSAEKSYRESMSSLARRDGALAAVNGGYFLRRGILRGDSAVNRPSDPLGERETADGYCFSNVD